MSGSGESWLGSDQLAKCAGITRRAATKTLARAACGKSWNGKTIVVRAVGGRGGRSGLCYEVALSSLSEELQDAFRGNLPALPLFPAPAEPGPFVPRAANQHPRISKLFDLIEPAVRWGLTSEQRAAAIREIHARTGTPIRTLQRHVANFDKYGADGLARRQPRDAELARVIVSRRFDRAFRAAGGAPELLPQFGDFVDEQLKGLWKGRAGDAGAPDLGQLAEFLLFERCEELGLPIARADCWIGADRIKRWSNRKVVNLMRNNAKAFHDSLPRIARDWTKHAPMQTVVADVKHLDVMVTREDGTTAYPKMIGFMDAGTGRIFPYLVLCPERRSITQELVIEAFCAMASDPLWGFPNTLYLDNGSEFGGLDRILPALKLVNKDAGREIVHANPYNAAAKPIEPLFARLDRYCFSALPGYTGPDRQKKKTQNIGRAPEPFTGTWAEFTTIIGGLIGYYHGRHVKGQWNASPNDVFREKISDGWRPILPQPLALEMAFSERVQLKLSKQGIRTPAGRFTHPELAGVPIGTLMDVIMPYRKASPPIVILDEVGPVQLRPDYAFAAASLDGARESARRKQSYQRSVAAMEKEGPIIDPIGIKLRIANREDGIAIPGRRQFLDQGATVHDMRAARAAVEANDTMAHASENERRIAREMRITENLEREQGRVFKSV